MIDETESWEIQTEIFKKQFLGRRAKPKCTECNQIIERINEGTTLQNTPIYFAGDEVVCENCMIHNHNLVSKRK